MVLCKECKEREVKHKRYMLCNTCYYREYQKGNIAGRNSRKYRERSINKYVKKSNLAADLRNNPNSGQDGSRLNRELIFINNYFNHSNWIQHPAAFKLSEKVYYHPDFYDGERGVFIEVVGSRQAYHQNIEKYKLFKKTYSHVVLEIRSFAGDILDKYQRDLDTLKI